MVHQPIAPFSKWQELILRDYEPVGWLSNRTRSSGLLTHPLTAISVRPQEGPHEAHVDDHWR